MTAISKSSAVLQKSIKNVLLATCLAGSVQASELTNIVENTIDAAISGDGRVAAFVHPFGIGLPRLSYRALDDNTDAIQIAPDSNHSFSDIALSNDGQFIVFTSSSPDLVAGDTNNRDDVFVYDTQLDIINRVSVSSTGTESNNHSRDAGISADGRFIVFMSFADNLAADNNPGSDIFLYDSVFRTTRKVSIDSEERETIGGNKEPVISADGNFIAFTSNSSEFTTTAPFDLNGRDDVYIHSVADVTTVRVSTDVTQTRSDLEPSDFSSIESSGPSISADGRFVLYQAGIIPSLASEETDHNQLFSLRLRDTVAQVTTDVIVGADGLPADFDVTGGELSADGRFVVYESAATNLLEQSIPRQSNIFLTDFFTSETVLVSAPNDESGVASDFSARPSVSADGSRVIFQTLANNLVPVDADPNESGQTLSVLFENDTDDAEAPEQLAGPSDNCDYSNASIFQDWGWDPVASESCPPIESLGCDYSQADIHDGWGWNAGTGMSCEPL